MQQLATDDIGRVGRYRLKLRLGRGRTSEVYLAEDPLSAEPVAVRIAREVTDDVVARFRREAEAAGRLHHAGAVHVLDVGEDPTVGTYLVTEFVDGRPLPEYVAARVPGLEIRFELLRQVAAVLEAAHLDGVVHGALRGEKVLVRGDGTIKVTGFGSADAVARLEGVDQGIHLAPEILGESPHSAETDRYAYAVLAFQVLTQKPPYDRGYLVSEAPAPALPMAPDGLRSVFSKALARDPRRRYGSIRQFLRALIVASPLDPQARTRLVGELSEAAFRRAIARHRRLATLLASGALVIALAIAVFERLPATVPEPAEPRVVDVVSVPARATLLVDGEPVGETPRRLAVREGARRLRLEKPGYRSVDVSLENDEREFRVSLEPIAVASSPPATLGAPEGKPVGEVVPEGPSGGLLPAVTSWFQGIFEAASPAGRPRSTPRLGGLRTAPSAGPPRTTPLAEDPPAGEPRHTEPSSEGSDRPSR